MHDPQTQEKFLELRARGRSYQSIATELGVGRRTLLEWSQKFRFELQNRRAVAMETLQEQYLAPREERIHELGRRLREVEKELQQRSLAELSTPRLFQLADAIRRQIVRETGEVRFSQPVGEIPDDAYHEQAQEWAG